MPWPLGVVVDAGACAVYDAAHAKLLAHHLCLAMLRRTFQVFSAAAAALDGRHRHAVGRAPGAGAASGAASAVVPSAVARQQLHRLHLLRHQLQFVANSLTDHFAYEVVFGS